MKTSVLILAAGPYRHGWTEKAPKHLALIAGEPLILRTLRQLKKRGHDENVIVVTHNKAIQAVVPRYFDPPLHAEWSETLLATRELWQERTITFNGDTIFSPLIMDKILASQDSIMFYGRDWVHKEAMVFTSEKQKAVVEAALATIAAKVGFNLFYCMMCGLKFLEMKRAWCKEYHQVTHDYTFDIDSPERYKQFLSKHKWARNPKRAN